MQRGLAIYEKAVCPSVRLFLYFISPNSIALQAYYVTVVEDRPLLSAKYRLPLLAKTDPTCSAISLR